MHILLGILSIFYFCINLKKTLKCERGGGRFYHWEITQNVALTTFYQNVVLIKTLENEKKAYTYI